jgi:sugar phosphate isomerase/epimerase
LPLPGHPQQHLPDAHLRAGEVATISGWIGVAAALGARRVRISAGRQPPSPQVIERSASELVAFSAQAAELGLVVVTENWQTTAEQPETLLAILDRCAGQVGLCADTGNADATADKAATLAQLLPRASSVHFKARYTPQGEIDRDDLEQCARLVRQSGFDGVITLIYDRKTDEWAGLGRLRHALQPLLL